MTSRILRSTVVLLLFSAAAVQAEEPKRCSASAQECEREIRRMLSGRRYLGLQVHPFEHGGIVIKAVNPDSPAARGDFQQGDRIIAVNGRDMTLATAKEFKQVLADAKETGVLFIIIQRRGAYRKVETRLEPFPKSQIDKIVAQHLLQSHSTPSSSASAQP
jgi:predicted metalloprotease with PDZ domain